MTRRTDPRTVRTTLPAANPAGQLPDFTPGEFDFVADNFLDLARQLGA